MKTLICALMLASLTGCATMENYCDNHSRTCVVGAEVAVMAVVAVVAVEATKKDQVNVIPTTTVAKP